jgi:glycosyltransferase involved in cell wall biosynthesis
MPAGIDDPRRPSGGNTYDRAVCAGLAARGWAVHEHHVEGRWPVPGPADCAALAARLRDVPDGETLLVDGLLGSTAPGVLLPESDRLRLVVLVHLPLATDPACPPATGAGERAVLAGAAAVVTTSRWTRDWLVAHHDLPRERVHVAVPGAAPAPAASGSGSGQSLLCVAAVTPGKGHDLLLAALASVTDLPWRCVAVGALDLDPGHVAALRVRVDDLGLAERFTFAGPRTGPALDAAYDAADLLVLASRAETYGMVVTEALARGLPIVGTAAGGVPEALGEVDGTAPGVLTPPGDPDALAAALRRWLTDDDHRTALREVAARRRPLLPTWADTSARVAEALAGLR